eukprot:gene8832-404_t
MKLYTCSAADTLCPMTLKGAQLDARGRVGHSEDFINLLPDIKDWYEEHMMKNCIKMGKWLQVCSWTLRHAETPVTKLVFLLREMLRQTEAEGSEGGGVSKTPQPKAPNHHLTISNQRSNKPNGGVDAFRWTPPTIRVETHWDHADDDSTSNTPIRFAATPQPEAASHQPTTSEQITWMKSFVEDRCIDNDEQQQERSPVRNVRTPSGSQTPRQGSSKPPPASPISRDTNAPASVNGSNTPRMNSYRVEQSPRDITKMRRGLKHPSPSPSARSQKNDRDLNMNFGTKAPFRL